MLDSPKKGTGMSSWTSLKAKEYREKNKERIAKAKKIYREAHRQEHREENLRSYYKNKEKIMKNRREKYNNAGRLVNIAIKRGKLVKKPCEICGAEKAEAHHDDYNKPLEVRWLCKKHHTEWHRNNKPIYKIRSENET